jgi:hypothetical protein
MYQIYRNKIINMIIKTAKAENSSNNKSRDKFINYSVIDEYLNSLTDINSWGAEIFVQLR